MVKIRIDATVDLEVWQQAKVHGINVSWAAEYGLREVLNMQYLKEKARHYSSAMQKIMKEISDEDLMKCKAAVSRDIVFARGWKKIFKHHYEVDVSRVEIVKVFGGKEPHGKD